MLLDSNILIYGSKGEDAALDAILDRTDLSVASVSRIETLGYDHLTEIEQQWLEIAFDRMSVLPLDEAIVERAIELRRTRMMKLGDAIIAATALIHNLELVTRNIDDFKHVEGLKVRNPFAPPSG